jgi:hypothetical protein
VKVRNVHERSLTAPAAEVEALFDNIDALWPTPAFPAPAPADGSVLKLGTMLWEPVEREGAAKAYRIVGPDEFPAEHWFDVRDEADGCVLRHTVEGEAVGEFEGVWREQIEPMHDAYIEALFDRAQEALGS